MLALRVQRGIDALPVPNDAQRDGVAGTNAQLNVETAARRERIGLDAVHRDHDFPHLE